MRSPLSRPILTKRKKPAAETTATETLTTEVLSFLGENAERLDEFLAASGLDLADLREASRQAGFAESLLDHICADERLLLPFAQAHGYDPAAIERQRQALARPRDAD